MAVSHGDAVHRRDMDPPASASFRMDRVAAILVIVDGLALALLGPGAHSIDAYLFGRREIIIPHDLQHR